MTAQLLFLVMSFAALIVVLVVLVPGWRWRRAVARSAVPASGALGRLATVIDGSMRTSTVRTLRRGGTWSRDPGIDDVSPSDIDAVVAGRPRTVRPTRLVVSGPGRPPVAGRTTATTRADPRARLLHDMIVVVGLGAAVMLLSTLLPRSPDLESAVLGVTGEPAPLTPRPAVVVQLPEATAAGQGSPEPSPAPSTGPAASPSPAASVRADATAVAGPSSAPSPTATSTRTQGPRATARPTARPSESTVATPSPSSSSAPSDAPSPSDAPPPSDSPSLGPSASPNDPPTSSPAASPSAAPTPTPDPSSEPSQAP